MRASDAARPPIDRGTGGSLDVRMLGTLVVRRGDGTWIEPDEFRTTKTRHLLRLLALHDGVPVRAELLTDVLWPNVPIARARASLRTAASQLRRTLRCDAVVRVGDALELRGARVDAVDLERCCRSAMVSFASNDDAAGVRGASAAIALYRGDLAEDEPYLDPLVQASQRLQRMLLDLLLDAAAATLRLRRPTDAVTFAQRVAELDPSCERACRTLMQAYVGLDEPTMALRAYERCRRSIADELGVAPAPATQELHRRVLLLPATIPSGTALSEVA